MKTYASLFALTLTYAFLFALTLNVGCNSDDDIDLLPEPAPPMPAPGELPAEVIVKQFNLKDKVCPDVPKLDRSGVLTHIWSAITLYVVSSNEVKVAGDLLSTWDNNDCHSETMYPDAAATYPQGLLDTDVIITTTPAYFEP